MKFTCKAGELYRIVTACETITGNRLNISMVSNVLLEATAEKLVVKASNGTLTTEAELKAEVTEPGVVVLSQNKLQNVLSQYQQEELEVQLGKDNFALLAPLNSKRRAKTKILSFPAEEFPSLPSFEPEQVLALDKLYLKKMFSKVAFAASELPTKYALNGVFFKCNERRLEMAATDSRRIAIFKASIPEASHKAFELILPKELIQHLNKLLLTEGPLELAYNNGKLFFKFDNLLVTSNLINGEYPDYQAFLPTEHKYQAEVETTALSRAIGTSTSILDKELTKVIAWHFKPALLQLSSQEADYGTSEEQIEAEYEGAEEMRLGFNYKLISEVLRQIETDKVQFFFNTEDAAVTVREKNRDEYFFVVMPIRLREEE